MRKVVTLSRSLVGLVLLGGVSLPGWSIDGTILIDQNKAFAGNVTPGDAPGFPVTISQPGSYKLSGNLTVPDANTTAIDITASFVTLDLNGFAISGPASCTYSAAVGVVCTNSGSGIGVKAGAVDANGLVTGPDGTSVRNGSVRGMGGHGILLNNGIVDNVQAWSNGKDGIISFNKSMVTRSLAILNGRTGILANQGVVNGNTAMSNGNSGIAGNGIVVTQNSAIQNWWWGLELLGDSGYFGNVLSVNNYDPSTSTWGAQVVGGQSLGKNACDPGPGGGATPCP